MDHRSEPGITLQVYISVAPDFPRLQVIREHDSLFYLDPISPDAQPSQTHFAQVSLRQY